MGNNSEEELVLWDRYDATHDLLDAIGITILVSTAVDMRVEFAQEQLAATTSIAYRSCCHWCGHQSRKRGEPVLKNITPEVWAKFRKLFIGKRTMLWVTRGDSKMSLWGNMMIGFGQPAVLEEDALRVQFIDITDIGNIDAQELARYLVRLTARQLDN
ncbi:hypothetical protein F5X98DRAFT_373291 [Xylaria grammica]|nr:hypothetical protein F5X98DRAFT_373291 [Xylaria grammica]